MALNSYYSDIDIDPDAVNWWATSIGEAHVAVAMFVHNTHYFDSPCSDIVNDLRYDSFDCSSSSSSPTSCNCIRLNPMNSLGPR